MKYSIVTQKCGCHLLSEAQQRSFHKYLTPDEIIIENAKFKQHPKSERHGYLMNKGILKARNDMILLVDHDIMIFDNSLIEQMLEEASKPNTFVCSAFHKPYDGELVVLEICAVINRQMFLSNGIEFDGSGNPCYYAFKEAMRRGQRCIKIEGDKRVFHLEAGSKSHYTELIINGHWKKVFENWKRKTGSTESFDDYVVDDGMDIDDVHQLNAIVLEQLNRRIIYKEPFSLIRLGDLNLRYLDSYFNDPKDFVHVGTEHRDIAVPNNEVGLKLMKELIEGLKEADWIDHPDTYKGTFNYLYNWRGIFTRCNETYNKTGMDFVNKNFCSSIQGYLSLVKDFSFTLYDIMKDRKILFVAPYDTLGELNTRKDLKVSKYQFYQLSLSNDYNERYSSMEGFFKSFNPNDWDVVLVMGGFYGRIIISRIRKLGGRAFDLGQAVRFSPDNIFDKVVTPIENQTYYSIIDGYKKA
jgi:glycosyltransferase involved in cell wall biosynthesis